ncbi:MAG: Holliday junction resolvase Hjc [Nanoarchaeota archaeon]
MAKSFRFRKAKGTLAENELIHRFWDNGWVCVRVAGSGSGRYPSPDLLASRGDRKIVMEVKVIGGIKKYFSKKEIDDLNLFANKFAAESWVGVQFEKKQWHFIPVSELDISKQGNFSIDLISMKRKGFTFEDMIGF